MKGLKRLLLASVLCAGYTQASMAIGAYPKPILMRQPDGTTLLVRIQGDENFHYVTTTDGFFLEKNKKGYYCYVDYDAKSGVKNLTKQRAHNVDSRSAKEVSFVKTLTPASKANIDILSKKPIVKMAPKTILNHRVSAPRKVLGPQAEIKESQYLVILVNFTDSVMRHSRDDFDKWLNEPGYSENGGTGSVKDYYRDNSMGQFVPNFQVVGPYTLSKPTSYYGGNYDSSSNGTDSNPRDMVKEAVQLAKADHPDLDFSQFDNDGDGEMDNCYVIYAGYSEASTARPDDIWPHSWFLDGDYRVDGTKIYNYSCSAELVGQPGYPVVPSMDGIGTFTHEFGHVLGLKDMYDTNDTDDGVGLDPGDYSLFASGSYNNDSHTPPCLMAFERLQMGWMKEGEDIIEVKNPEDVTLGKLADNKARFINCQPDRTPGTGMEWYILENRQQEGWDKFIPAHGLVITRYDYTDEMQNKWWSVNGPNNSSRHRCMYIVPADGIDDAATRTGDTFPGITGNTSFTDTTTPSSLNWSNEPVNVPITNIIEQDGNVRFQVSGGVSEWDFIKTLAPLEVLDTQATFKASVESNHQDVKEVGFCWKAGATAQPSLSDFVVKGQSGSVKAEDISNPVGTVQGLKANKTYSVRSYMKMADGSVVYGSSVPFTTEMARYDVTLETPFYTNFLTWSNGAPEGWQIVDNNVDGTTWIQDEAANAIRYSFNYWNDADDYLIYRRRFHVPEKGALFFTRGVVETSGVEDLEVLVSTKSSNKDDFHLVKRFSFADYFGDQHMEEVDLSQYAGKDIYVAFRVCSEKLQNDLWLWNVLMTQKLDTPQNVKLERVDDDVLTATWSPVEGANNYYVNFSKETTKTNTQVLFTPMSFYEDVKGDVILGTGSINFRGSGSVTLKDCPEGIKDCKFVTTCSGPMGTSELNIEGTEDGKTWTAVGAKIYLDSYDSEGQEQDYTPYLSNKTYRQLRFNFKNGGRLARIKYLTISYTDGKIYEDLASGYVTETEASAQNHVQGEFNEGKYRIWVAAGRDNIYYDESKPVYYSAASTAIRDVIENTGIGINVDDHQISVDGIKAGYTVTCTAASGVQLYSGVATTGSLGFQVPAGQGVAVVTVSGEGHTYRSKIIIK